MQVQHNLADFSTWEPIEYDLVYTKMDGPCAVDPFLAAFCKAVKEQAERKMQAGGIETGRHPAAPRRGGRAGRAADLTGRSGCAAGAADPAGPLSPPWAILEVEGQETGRPKTMKRLIMAATAAFAIAAPAAADDFKPAVIFDTGGKFDKSFNEAAYNGAEKFKKESGVSYAEFEITNEIAARASHCASWRSAAPR